MTQNFPLSVRTLTITAALVGLYFAGWEVTKRYGIPNHIKGQARPLSDLGHQPERMTVWVDAPIPLLLREYTYEMPPKNGLCQQLNYRFWLFGANFKIPIRGNWVYVGFDGDVRVDNWLFSLD